MKKNDFEDDGRVIADMSILDRSRTRIPVGNESPDQPESAKNGYESGRWNEHIELDGREKLWAILGMLKAGLIIGGIYLIAFAAVILLLLFLWGGFK